MGRLCSNRVQQWLGRRFLFFKRCSFSHRSLPSKLNKVFNIPIFTFSQLLLAKPSYIQFRQRHYNEARCLRRVARVSLLSKKRAKAMGIDKDIAELKTIDKAALCTGTK